MGGYRLSPAAQADLESIRDHAVTHRGEPQAEDYTRNIQVACEALIEGTMVSRSAEEVRAGYRKVAVGSHVMYFRIQSDTLEIIRILHKSMDVERQLPLRRSLRSSSFPDRNAPRCGRPVRPFLAGQASP